MKRIGIFGWKTGENSFGITAPYFSFLESFNSTVEIITPSPEPRIDDLDLIVVPGGADVNPLNYGMVARDRKSVV